MTMQNENEKWKMQNGRCKMKIQNEDSNGRCKMKIEMQTQNAKFERKMQNAKCESKMQMRWEECKRECKNRFVLPSLTRTHTAGDPTPSNNRALITSLAPGPRHGGSPAYIQQQPPRRSSFLLRGLLCCFFFLLLLFLGASRSTRGTSLHLAWRK